MNFLVINPQFDTPANFIILIALTVFAVWSAIYSYKQNKQFKEENK